MLEGIKKAYADWKENVFVSMALIDLTLDEYFNSWQEQLEKRGLARHVEPQERKPRSLKARLFRAAIATLIVYFLLGVHLAALVGALLALLIWFTSDFRKQKVGVV